MSAAEPRPGLLAVRDRAGLTVLDERGAIVAITTDRAEAGLFVGEGDPWLASKGLRRVGAWQVRHYVLEQPDRLWPYDVPGTHSEARIERIPS